MENAERYDPADEAVYWRRLALDNAADRDRLAAENARLREAVTAIAAAKLRYEASSLVFGEEHHALMDAIEAARSLVEAPR